MDFKDIVKQSLKTKEQLSQEEIDKGKKAIIQYSRYLFNNIKNSIVNKASRGEAVNGVIKDIYHIDSFAGRYNGVDVPVVNGYAKATIHTRETIHDRFFRVYHVRHLTVNIYNIDGIISVYNVLLSLCKQEGISISQPFFHAVISEYSNRSHSEQKVINEDIIPIKNGMLQHKIRYRCYDSNTPDVESGNIYLAVEYEFNI